MRMYKIQRTTKDSNTAHRYRTNFCRFLKPLELATERGEEIKLFTKQEASNWNKSYRKADRKHNYKMVLADNI